MSIKVSELAVGMLGQVEHKEGSAATESSSLPVLSQSLDKLPVVGPAADLKTN